MTRHTLLAIALTAALAALTVATPLAGHHSFDAEFDREKTIDITGVVTKVDWVNPHAFVYVDARDEQGEVTRYTIEMGPPYALVRGGWTRNTLKIGDTVTVTGAALAKDGSPAAGSLPTTSMHLADGRSLTMR
jgi:hypothetical protein